MNYMNRFESWYWKDNNMSTPSVSFLCLITNDTWNVFQPTHALLSDALALFDSTYKNSSPRFRNKHASDQKLSCRHNNKTVTLTKNREVFTEDLRKVFM